MSRLKQLGKDSLIYGIGGVVAKGIGFFLLPIYTRIFSPAEYGTIEMLSIISSFLSAFLVMGMDSAQSFYFFEQRDKGKAAQARLVSAILQWRLLWGSAIVLVATVCAPLLNAFLFDGGLSWHYFALAFAGALFGQLMGQSAEVMRLLYRPWAYLVITLSKTLISVAIVLVLVLVFGWGIISFFVATLVAAVFVAVAGWYLVRDYLDFSRLHTDWWPRVLRFGLPLVPAGLAMYGMNTSGRWFVQFYHGSEALGMYAVGARFALLLALGVETFRRAWLPIAMDSMHSDDGPEMFRLLARLYMGVGVATVVVLTLLSPWLVSYMTGPAFHDSWRIVGVLAWQSLFYGFFLVASLGMFKAEKTHLHMYLMGAAVAVNIVLNLWLVPEYGAMGAALATALAFLVWISASVVVSERLWNVGVPFGVLTAQVTFGAAVVAWLIVGYGAQSPLVRNGLGGVAALLLVFFSLDAVHRRQLFKGFAR